MKKQIAILSALLVSVVSYSQIKVQSGLTSTISRENPFLDASAYNQAGASVGKGLAFPRTDLRTFKFKIDQLGQYQNFLSAFDGMIVYNTGTGVTGADKNTQGEQVYVEPGFYFFYHPTATEDTNNVSKGRWVRIGDSFGATPTYVAVGTFVHDGGNSAILTNMPNASEFKAIKSIIIRRIDDNGNLLGGVTATTLYSYDDVTKKAVFGQGVISTPIPAGNYEYIIQYSK